MSLISFSNVTKYYSNDLILDHISFNINKNEKVALIGDNGTGKTTILKMILNEEDMTPIYNEEIKGNISILKNTRIGYLNQNCIEDVNNTVYQELLLVFKDQIELNFNIDKMLELIKSNPNDLELLNQYEI
ncbi:MAG: ATP-binding cassette domain-containing protein [Bacillales bacterium]